MISMGKILLAICQSTAVKRLSQHSQYKHAAKTTDKINISDKIKANPIYKIRGLKICLGLVLASMIKIKCNSNFTQIFPQTSTRLYPHQFGIPVQSVEN